MSKGEFLDNVEAFLAQPEAAEEPSDFAGFACLIGIAQFQSLPALPGAGQDVAILGEQLRQPAHGYKYVAECTSEVTRQRLQDECDALCQAVLSYRAQHPNLSHLTVLLYFATHGWCEQDSYALCTQETRWEQGSLHEALSFSTLRQWLAPLQQETVVLILDTCRQMTYDHDSTSPWPLLAERSAFVADPGLSLSVGRNWGILAASPFGELAWEYAPAHCHAVDQEPFSLLARAIWRVLRQPASRIAPWWTFQMFVYQVRQHMRRAWLHTTKNNGPVHYLAAERDIIVARKLPRFLHSPQQNPFRPLESYGETDSERFFGRQEALQQWLGTEATETSPLFGLFRHHLLVGTSGAGKTSFLKAALVPALRTAQHPVLCLDVRQPQSISHYTLSAADPSEPPCSLLTRIQQIYDVSGGPRDVVIILDQLESLFLDAGGAARYTKWLNDIQELLLCATPPPYRLILSLRDDALTYWYRPLLQHNGSETLADWFLLSHEQIHVLPVLTPTQARSVLEQTLSDYPIQFSQRVVDQMLLQLVQHFPEQPMASGHRASIYPPHLQIVASTLYQRGLREKKLQAPDAREWVLDTEVSVPRILQDHIAQTIEGEQQGILLTPEEQECAWHILTVLCLRSHPHQPLHEEALIQRVQQRGYPPVFTRNVLIHLADRRLLRSFAPANLALPRGDQQARAVWAYSHDHMVALVQKRLADDPHTTQVLHAKRLLETLVYPVVQEQMRVPHSEKTPWLGLSTALDVQAHFLEATQMIREEVESSVSLSPQQQAEALAAQEQLTQQASDLIASSIRYHQRRERVVRWGVPLVVLLAALVLFGTWWLQRATREAQAQRTLARKASAEATQNMRRSQEQKAEVLYRTGLAYTGHYYKPLLEEHEANLKRAFQELREAQRTLPEREYPLFHAALWVALGNATRNREGLPKVTSLRAINMWNRALTLYQQALSSLSRRSTKQAPPYRHVELAHLPWSELPQRWKAYQTFQPQRIGRLWQEQPQAYRKILRWLLRYQLGKVHRQLAHAHRDRMERVGYKQTFFHFRRALQLYRTLGLLREVTATQVEMAWGYIYGRDTLGPRMALNKALALCREAGRFLSRPEARRKHAVLWAEWQYAIGCIWLNWPDPVPQRANNAVRAYENALQIFTPRRYPKRSLWVQGDLAHVHLDIAQGICATSADHPICLQHIKQATRLFRELLARVNKRKAPLTWAIFAQYTARALTRWPDPTGQRMKEARTLLKQALKIRNPTHEMLWAYTYTYWLEWQEEQLRRRKPPVSRKEWQSLLQQYKKHVQFFDHLDRKRMQLRVCLGGLRILWRELHDAKQGLAWTRRCLSMSPRRRDLQILLLRASLWAGQKVDRAKVQRLFAATQDNALQRMLLWTLWLSDMLHQGQLSPWTQRMWCRLSRHKPKHPARRWLWRLASAQHAHFIQHANIPPTRRHRLQHELRWLQDFLHPSKALTRSSSCQTPTSKKTFEKK